MKRPTGESERKVNLGGRCGAAIALRLRDERGACGERGPVWPTATRSPGGSKARRCRRQCGQQCVEQGAVAGLGEAGAGRVRGEPEDAVDLVVRDEARRPSPRPPSSGPPWAGRSRRTGRWAAGRPVRSGARSPPRPRAARRRGRSSPRLSLPFGCDQSSYAGRWTRQISSSPSSAASGATARTPAAWTARCRSSAAVTVRRLYGQVSLENANRAASTSCRWSAWSTPRAYAVAGAIRGVRAAAAAAAAASAASRCRSSALAGARPGPRSGRRRRARHLAGVAVQPQQQADLVPGRVLGSAAGRRRAGSTASALYGWPRGASGSAAAASASRSRGPRGQRGAGRPGRAAGGERHLGGEHGDRVGDARGSGRSRAPAAPRSARGSGRGSAGAPAARPARAAPTSSAARPWRGRRRVPAASLGAGAGIGARRAGAARRAAVPAGRAYGVLAGQACRDSQASSGAAARAHSASAAVPEGVQGAADPAGRSAQRAAPRRRRGSCAAAPLIAAGRPAQGAGGLARRRRYPASVGAPFSPVLPQAPQEVRGLVLQVRRPRTVPADTVRPGRRRGSRCRCATPAPPGVDEHLLDVAAAAGRPRPWRAGSSSPSGPRCQEEVVSDIPVSSSRLRAARWAGSVTRTSASIRRSRLRCIMSALPIHTSGSPPLPKAKTRECSRKRPRTQRTRMFSDRPATPGRTAQMPRTQMSTGTPACEAR